MAVLAVLVAAGPAWGNTDTRSFGERQGCDHTHRSKVAYKQIRALVRHTRPTVDKQRVNHYATCLATRRKAHHAHELARAYWRWRHEYAQLWVIRWNRVDGGWQSWATSTASCESGMDPTAHNPSGVYHGMMQFDLGTWAEAGGYGDPHNASASEQLTRAVWLAQRVGTGRWPVCGH